MVWFGKSIFDSLEGKILWSKSLGLNFQWKIIICDPKVVCNSLTDTNVKAKKYATYVDLENRSQHLRSKLSFESYVGNCSKETSICMYIHLRFTHVRQFQRVQALIWAGKKCSANFNVHMLPRVCLWCWYQTLLLELLNLLCCICFYKYAQSM
jgi:hypothetical protein